MLEPCRGIGERSLESLERMWSADFKLTHVTEIENPSRISDRKMLLDNPAVTHGHLETTENGHPCAEFLVKVE
jgi:hypothetical protein